MTPMTLTEFLRARISEDEATANQTGELNPQDWAVVADDNAADVGWHVLRWSPPRVLAECEAKRLAIDAAWADHTRVVWLEEEKWGSGKSQEQMSAEGDNPAVVKALALPYADHPDYLDEWRP